MYNFIWLDVLGFQLQLKQNVTDLQYIPIFFKTAHITIVLLQGKKKKENAPFILMLFKML